MSLDDRLRDALHDLDARAAAHAGRAPREAAPPRRARLLVPALAAVAVVAVLLGAAVAFRTPDRGTGPAHGTQVTPSPAPPRNGASQSPADAERDRVHPLIAALPVLKRLAGSNELQTEEGNWAITEPDLSGLPLDADGCLPQAEGGPAYRVCNGYSEVILLGPTGIVRAYPFPAFTPTWSTTSDTAFYCGRPGDGAVPQNAVCRIDRETLELTGRVYACDGPDCAPRDEDDLATWPGHWSQGTKPIDEPFQLLDFVNGELVTRNDRGEAVAVLDPLTLLER